MKLIFLNLCTSLYKFIRFGGGGGGFGGGGYHGGGGFGGYHGGGHGSGHVSKEALIIIVFIVISIIIIIYLTYGFFRKLKLKKAEAVLQISYQKDIFWDKEKMINHAKDVYTKLQIAWEKQNLDLISNFVSSDFYEMYNVILQRLINKNITNEIVIHQFVNADIIGVQDYIDNSLDRFSIFIKVEMTDRMYYDGYLKNGTEQMGYVEEILHFARIENDWYLCSIQTDTSLNGVSMVRNFHESIDE